MAPEGRDAACRGCGTSLQPEQDRCPVCRLAVGPDKEARLFRTLMAVATVVVLLAVAGVLLFGPRIGP